MSERKATYQVPQQQAQLPPRLVDEYVPPAEMDQTLDQLIAELEAIKAEYRKLYAVLVQPPGDGIA